MLAPTSTRNGACWIARRAHRHALAQRRFDGLRERRRLLDVARLRHLPQDHLDVARAAAEDRQRLALAVRHPLRGVAVLVEAQVEHLGAARRLAGPTRSRAG